jgi:hypothetical protein
MSTDSFDDILKQARSLSAEEQQKLIKELARSAAHPNGTDQRSLYDVLKARGLVGFMTDETPKS